MGITVGSLVSLAGSLSGCSFSPFAPACESSPAWLVAIPVGCLIGYAPGRQSITEVWSAWSAGSAERLRTSEGPGNVE